MTEKSVLEKLRENLAKVCEQQIDTDERRGRLQARSILVRCADTIRAHDLSIYESATPQVSSSIGSTTRNQAELDGAADHIADPGKMVADPDVAGLIERLHKAGSGTCREAAAALQRQADQLAAVQLKEIKEGR